MTDVRFDFTDGAPLWGIFGENPREADAVFPIIWNGESVEVAVFWKKFQRRFAVLMFRQVESSEIYLVASFYPHEWQIGMEWFFVRSHRHKTSLSEKARGILSDALARGASGYGSIHRLSERTRELPVPQWLFLLEDQTRGCWDAGFADSTPFRVRDANDLTSHAIENPATPIGYALQWSQLALEEQCKRALIFENGDWEEFKRVSRAIFYFESAHGEEKLVIKPDGRFLMGTDNVPRSMWKSPGIRARRWASYLQSYFAPSRNQQLAQEHLCVASQFLDPLLTLNLPQLTQHERLEAALTLRDWAKGKIPEREARLLLPKL